jgi:hypothetical protein
VRQNALVTSLTVDPQVTRKRGRSEGEVRRGKKEERGERKGKRTVVGDEMGAEGGGQMPRHSREEEKEEEEPFELESKGRGGSAHYVHHGRARRERETHVVDQTESESSLLESVHEDLEARNMFNTRRTTKEPSGGGDSPPSRCWTGTRRRRHR